MTMVQSDPTSYPDENPLLHPVGDDVLPLTEEILGTTVPTTESTPSTTPRPTAQPSATPATDQGGDTNVGLPLAIGAGVLLLIALVTAVIITRRRGRATTSSGI